MFSALISDIALKAGSGGYSPFDTQGFGHAPLDAQTTYDRAYSPLPDASGQLTQDPDFTLPTTAGPLRWQLFYYSALSNQEGPFGYGRRASWPLRLCLDGLVPGFCDDDDVLAGTSTDILTVTLEREDGTHVRYVSDDDGDLHPTTQRCFDSLVLNEDGSWDETRLDTGNTFHYPAAPVGAISSLAYFETPQGARVTFNYDSYQRLESIEDPAQRLITYTYDDDSDNLVITVEDWANRTFTFAYDEDLMYLAAVQDPNGEVTNYEYNDFGSLTNIIDPTGRSTKYLSTEGVDSVYIYRREITYPGSTGAPDYVHEYGYYSYESTNTSATIYGDPNGQIWTTVLDANSNILNTIDPLGATRTAVYDANGLPTQTVDANGNTINCTYNSQGRMLSRENSLGYTEYWTYDSYGNKTSYQDQIGRTTLYSYGTGTEAAMRRMVSKTTQLGFETDFFYNSWGALTEARSPLGNPTYYSWNDLGQMVTATDGMGGVRTFLYNAAGNKIVEIDEMSRTVTCTFDSMDNMLTRINGIGALEQWARDPIGRVILETDPLNNVTTYAYDVVERDDEYPIIRYDYTWQGERSEVFMRDGKDLATSRFFEMPAPPDYYYLLGPLYVPGPGAAQYVFDSADRMVAEVDSAGAITTHVFDLGRRQIAVLGSSGLRYTTVFDANDRPVQRIDPAGLITETVYDPAGYIVGQVDSAGLRHTTIYDADCRTWMEIEPTGGCTTKTYDHDARVIAVVDAEGFEHDFNYDAANRLTVHIDPMQRRFTSVYDAAGALSQELNPDGTSMQWFHDGAGRPCATLDNLGNTTTTTYNAINYVTHFQDEYGNTSQDAYDQNNRLSSTQDEYGNTYSASINTNNGLLIGQSNSLGASVDHDTDIAGNLLKTTANSGRSFSFTYDQARLISTVDTLGNERSINYDDSGRPIAHIDELGHTTTTIYDDFGRVHQRIDPLGGSFQSNYDPFGRLGGYTNQRGYSVTVTYDLLHRPIARTNESSYVSSIVYNSIHQIVNEIDALGFVTSHLYDGRGNHYGSVDPLGRSSTYTFDEYSRRVGAMDPSGAITTVGYNSVGDPTLVVDATGNPNTILYDARGRASGTRNAFGQNTAITYDSAGRVSSVSDTGGNSSTRYYDSLGRTHVFQDQNGNVTTYTFDVLDRTHARHDPTGGVTTTVFDARSSHVGTIDPYGQQYSYTMDPLFRLTAGVDPAGATFTYLFNEVGSCTAQIDPSGSAYTYTLDAQEQLSSMMDPSGYVVYYDFNAVNLMSGSHDSLGRRYTYLYDAARQNTANIDPGNSCVTAVWDIAGRVSANIDADGYRTSYLYDVAGRHVATQDAMGYFETYVYDTIGNCVQTIDTLSRVTTTIYDISNRPTATIAPDGVCETVMYDSYGNVISYRDGSGNLTQYFYDTMNRLIEWEDPLGRSRSQLYDLNGHLVLEIDARSQVTTHIYDISGNEIVRQWNDGTLATFTYDTRGLRLTARDPIGAYTMTYDSMARLTSVVTPTHPGGAPISYQYDTAGRLSETETWWGSFNYSYDALDQLLTVSDPGYAAGGVPAGTTTLVYDVRQLQIEQLNANGTSTSIIYDPLQRVTSTVHIGADGIIDYAAYNRNAVGSPLSIQTGSYTATYLYDLVDQLVYEQAADGSQSTYVYDTSRRRSHVVTAAGVSTYSYDIADELLSIVAPTGRTTLQYDLNGSTTSVQSSTGRTTYTWDAVNRLESITTSLNQTFTQIYGYDSLRIGQIEPTARDTYTYDGLDVLFWQRSSTGAGSGDQLFTHGADLLRAVGSDDASGLDRHYHVNATSSVQLITDGAGATVTEYATDAFGNVLSGEADQNAFTYVGGLGYWEEALLGLYYVRARWLNPATGNWLSVDPLLDEPRYSYVRNQPTLMVDPMGTDGFDPVGWVTGEANALGNKVVQVGRNVVQAGRQIVTATAQGAQYVARQVGRAVNTVANLTEQGLAALQDGWRNLGTLCAKGLIAWITAMFQALGIPTATVNRVLAFAHKMGDAATDFLRRIGQLIGEFANNATATLKHLAQSLGQRMRYLIPVNEARNTLTHFLLGILKFAGEHLLEFLEGVAMKIITTLVPGVGIAMMIKSFFDMIMGIVQGGLSINTLLGVLFPTGAGLVDLFRKLVPELLKDATAQGHLLANLGFSIYQAIISLLGHIGKAHETVAHAKLLLSGSVAAVGNLSKKLKDAAHGKSEDGPEAHGEHQPTNVGAPKHAVTELHEETETHIPGRQGKKDTRPATDAEVAELHHHQDTLLKPEVIEEMKKQAAGTAELNKKGGFKNKTGNVAFFHVTIDGVRHHVEGPVAAVSGGWKKGRGRLMAAGKDVLNDVRHNMFNIPPQNRRKTPITASGGGGVWHTEYHIIEGLHQNGVLDDLQALSTSHKQVTLTIVTDRFPCPMCNQLPPRFHQLYPGVDIVFAHVRARGQ